MDEKLGKNYMLCSKKQIQSLIASPTHVKLYPFFTYYRLNESTDRIAFKVVISAPKKKFRKAHERNRVKRLIKEGIRKNKLILESILKESNYQLTFFIIYTAKDEMDYDFILGKTHQLFKKLSHEISINLSGSV